MPVARHRAPPQVGLAPRSGAGARGHRGIGAELLPGKELDMASEGKDGAPLLAVQAPNPFVVIRETSGVVKIISPRFARTSKVFVRFPRHIAHRAPDHGALDGKHFGVIPRAKPASRAVHDIASTSFH